MIDPAVLAVTQCLSQIRFSLHDEKRTQAEISSSLAAAGIPHQREFRLSNRDIVDFMIDGRLAMEIKIKGRRRDIFHQMERYAAHDIVQQLILVTNVPMGFPPSVNGKQVFVLNLAKAWL